MCLLSLSSTDSLEKNGGKEEGGSCGGSLPTYVSKSILRSKFIGHQPDGLQVVKKTRMGYNILLS